MRYPKRSKTGFTEESQSRQVNVHIGRKFDYWFVEPNERPYVVASGSVPIEMFNVEIEFSEIGDCNGHD